MAYKDIFIADYTLGLNQRKGAMAQWDVKGAKEGKNKKVNKKVYVTPSRLRF